MSESIAASAAVERRPDLTGRIAVCNQHRKPGQYARALMTSDDPGPGRAPSSWKLPFFEHRPDRETDSYYCGCWGFE
jgi:hypothetical protein